MEILIFSTIFFACKYSTLMKKGPDELREGLNEKKTFSFGHCPNEGGRGGLPMPEFLGPLFRSAFLVNKKSLFLQKYQCIELLTVF